MSLDPPLHAIIKHIGEVNSHCTSTSIALRPKRDSANNDCIRFADTVHKHLDCRNSLEETCKTNTTTNTNQDAHSTVVAKVKQRGISPPPPPETPHEITLDIHSTTTEHVRRSMTHIHPRAKQRCTPHTTHLHTCQSSTATTQK